MYLVYLESIERFGLATFAIITTSEMMKLRSTCTHEKNARSNPAKLSADLHSQIEGFDACALLTSAMKLDKPVYIGRLRKS